MKTAIVTLGIILSLTLLGTAYFSYASEPIESNSSLPNFHLQIPIPGFDSTRLVETRDAPDGKVVYAAGIGRYIAAVYTWLTGAVAILAVLIIMWAGFMWTTAAGDGSKIKKAKELISNALIGLTAVFGAYTILYVINPDLVKTGPLILGSELKKIPIELGEYSRATPQSLTPLPAGTVTQNIARLKETYIKIGNEEDVPWKLLAAIHYKEGGNNPSQSALNGFAICNNRDGSRCSACDTGVTIENDLRCAARTLKRKATLTGFASQSYPERNQTFTLNKNTTDAATLANVAYRYNGVGYGPYTKSPYVMNNMPGYTNMTINGCTATDCCQVGPPKTGCWITRVEANDGVLAFLSRLQ